MKTRRVSEEITEKKDHSLTRRVSIALPIYQFQENQRLSGPIAITKGQVKIGDLIRDKS